MTVVLESVGLRTYTILKYSVSHVCSVVPDSAAPLTVVAWLLCPWEFSRQEYWLPFPSPGDHPDPGIKPISPALAGGFFTTRTLALLFSVIENILKD